MSSWFNADSNEALFGSSTRVFSNSKESYGRPIIGLSSPTEKQNYSKRSLSKASSSILRLQWMVAGLANDSGSL
jgi:hypothetical protein